eukprot:gene11494-4658_t
MSIRQPLTPLKQVKSPLVKEHSITINKTPYAPEIQINLPSTPIAQVLFPDSPILMSPLKNKNSIEEKENSFFSCATIPFKYFLNPVSTGEQHSKKLMKLQKELNQTHQQIQNLKENAEREISNLIQSNLTLKSTIKDMENENIKMKEFNENRMIENMKLKKENEELMNKLNIEKEIVNDLKRKKIDDNSSMTCKVLNNQSKKEKRKDEVNNSFIELSTFVILIGMVIMLF